MSEDLPNEVPHEDSKQSESNANVQSLLQKLKPLAIKCGEIYVKIAPYLSIAYEKGEELYTKAKPLIDKYYFPGLINLILGIILLFFGGNFAMTIACLTAIQLTGWKQIKTSYNTIKLNYDKALIAALKDKNAMKFLDEDGDGDISLKEQVNAFVVFIKADANTKFEILKQMRSVFVAVDPQEVCTYIYIFDIFFIHITVLIY